MDAPLGALVAAARDALCAEDKFIRERVEDNAIYTGARSFILRDGFQDERYYQRLIARKILDWPFNVILEKNRHDLVLVYPQRPEDWFAVIEMKLWMDKTGNAGLPKIIDDIQTLKHVRARHRIMLVFAANPIGDTKSSVRYLSRPVAREMGTQLRRGQNWEVTSFLTSSEYCEGDACFWIAGFEVPPHQIAVV